jgi:hypothetical protein
MDARPAGLAGGFVFANRRGTECRSCRRSTRRLPSPYILKAEARADVGAIGPPAQLATLCNAGGFSAQQIQLSSSRVDN